MITLIEKQASTSNNFATKKLDLNQIYQCNWRREKKKCNVVKPQLWQWQSDRQAFPDAMWPRFKSSSSQRSLPFLWTCIRKKQWLTQTLGPSDESFQLYCHDIRIIVSTGVGFRVLLLAFLLKWVPRNDSSACYPQTKADFTVLACHCAVVRKSGTMMMISIWGLSDSVWPSWRSQAVCICVYRGRRSRFSLLCGTMIKILKNPKSV